jgi:mono/diheme cytochrome c family protein
MRYSAALLVFAVAALPVAALAQGQLTDKQMHGRKILTQNCNVCHLPQNPGSATYGPRLSKTSTNGDDMLMREVILNGLVRMPAWKYTLSNDDVSDIIAYVRTLPEPPAPTTRGGGGGEGG